MNKKVLFLVAISIMLFVLHQNCCLSFLLPQTYRTCFGDCYVVFLVLIFGLTFLFLYLLSYFFCSSYFFSGVAVNSQTGPATDCAMFSLLLNIYTDCLKGVWKEYILIFTLFCCFFSFWLTFFFSFFHLFFWCTS